MAVRFQYVVGAGRLRIAVGNLKNGGDLNAINNAISLRKGLAEFLYLENI